MPIRLAVGEGSRTLVAASTGIEICSCVLAVSRSCKVFASGILHCIAVAVRFTVGEGIRALFAASTGIEVGSRILTVCRFVKIFAIGILHSIAMSVCFHCFLRYKNVTADRALFAHGQSRFGTGRGNGGDYLFLMLGAEVYFTYIASIIVVLVGMPVGLYDLLRYKHLVTNRAMLTFG